MQIETRGDADGVVNVVLSGEFDLAGIELFDAAISSLEGQGAATIVVDLTGLRFMDSSGLRALVLADRRARKAERRFAIVPGPPPVRRVFEITQLDEELDLIDSPSALER